MTHFLLAYFPFALIALGALTWFAVSRRPMNGWDLVRLAIGLGAAGFVGIDYFFRVRPFDQLIERRCAAAEARNIDTVFSLARPIRAILLGDNIPCNFECASLILSKNDGLLIYKAVEDAAQGKPESFFEYSAAGTQCERAKAGPSSMADVNPECVTTRIVRADDMNIDVEVNSSYDMERIGKNTVRTSELVVLADGEVVFRRQSVSFDENQSYASRFYFRDAFPSDRYGCNFNRLSSFALLDRIAAGQRSKSQPR